MEKFKIVDYHCLETYHFHCVSEANAWAWAHALSMVTWFNQQIVTFGWFSKYEKGKKWPKVGHFWGLKFGQKIKSWPKNSKPGPKIKIETKKNLFQPTRIKNSKKKKKFSKKFESKAKTGAKMTKKTRLF